MILPDEKEAMRPQFSILQPFPEEREAMLTGVVPGMESATQDGHLKIQQSSKQQSE